MAAPRGFVVLMGSGELTATMVEVHKGLLAGLGTSPVAVFLDTPAGFQLNAGQLAARAVAYFRERVRHPLGVASLPSAQAADTFEGQQALAELRRADYVLVGPGSPTYAVRQWRQTPVPEILVQRIQEGACLVAASAAALTMGRFTLPVYEIYKVGEDPRWVDGIDVLGRLGLDLVVVPHWNNAEGGTHDTRFCYMGEPRFRALEALLPEGTTVLGIDEHTACVLDLGRGEADVRGIGSVVVRRGGRERTFRRGEGFSLGVLRGEGAMGAAAAPSDAGASRGQEVSAGAPGGSFWAAVRQAEEAFREGLERRDAAAAANAVLDVDRLLWGSHADLADPEATSQAREVLREMVVLLGTGWDAGPEPRSALLGGVVEGMLALRARWREEGRWADADALRDCLAAAGIAVEDTPAGPRWRPGH